MTGRIKDETELVQSYLAPLAAGFAGAFGLRDDAALIATEPGIDLVVTADPVIAGVHFLATDRPDDIAWKALAVNVSDLAAKGARPLGYILTLAFPEAPEHAWMADFARGLEAAQAAFGCALVGGDTDRTPGALTIGVTAFGTVPRGRFVRRQGAAAGDHVFVTGTFGDSALGLALHMRTGRHGTALTEGDRAFLVGRYLRPNPRLALAPVLAAHASAALDVSDGLLKDLVRLSGGSGVTVEFGAIPLSPPTAKALARDAAIADQIVSGGDDYEILCSVSEARLGDFERGAAATGIAVARLGVLVAGAPTMILGPGGEPMLPRRAGYDHFS